jgi:cobalt/nickel transport protein
MKLDKLQRKILIILVILSLITPVGILLPMVINAGDAWGEWSAQTVEDLIGYMPQGLSKYSDVWKAPLTEYSVNSQDPSVVHQSGYYIVSGILGATISYIVMLVITRLIVKGGE